METLIVNNHTCGANCHVSPLSNEPSVCSLSRFRFKVHVLAFEVGLYKFGFTLATLVPFMAFLFSFAMMSMTFFGSLDNLWIERGQKAKREKPTMFNRDS